MLLPPPMPPPGLGARLKERWNARFDGQDETERLNRKRALRWALGILAALAVYPVVGTLMLWTGLAERLIRSEDLEVQLGNPSWTVLPGRVHVASARVLVNGETQFELRAKNLLFDVEVFPLLRKHLYVTRLKGDDVRYFMRVQVDDEAGKEERLAAYPKLEGLPGDNTVAKKKGQQTEEREGDFTVEVEGIDIAVAELWFMEYHYVGDGTLRGGFLIGPNRMRVGTSVQELGPGELRFGRDQVIAKKFGGRIQAAIPEVNPNEHADASFLELVTASVQLKGDVETLKHVGAYLPKMEVSDGAGPLATHVLLEKGYLGEGSHFTFVTQKLGLEGHGFGVLTDWDLDLRVGEPKSPEAAKAASTDPAGPKPEDVERAVKKQDSDEPLEKGPEPAVHTSKPDAEAKAKQGEKGPLPRLRSKSKSTYVSFSNERGDVFTVQIHGHDQDVTLKSKQLGSMTDIRHARARFPEIVTTDMDDLKALSADRKSLQSKSGSARASLFIDVDEKHVARGPFKARLDGLRLIVAGIDVRAEGKAELDITADLDAKTARFDDVSLKLRDVDLRVADEDVDDWWLDVTSRRVSTWGIPPTRIEADVAVRARSAEPLLDTLAAKEELNDLVADIVALNDLRMRGKLRMRGETIDVVLDPFESDVVDVAGRYYSKGEDTRMAFVVGGKALSLGFAKNRGGTTLMPFARDGWLNEQLGNFPNPDERVAPSKP